jgi:hypothetical protein
MSNRTVSFGVRVGADMALIADARYSALQICRPTMYRFLGPAWEASRWQ